MARARRYLFAITAVAFISGAFGFHLSRRTQANAATASAGAASGAVPFYDTRDFTPRWSKVSHRIAPFHLVDQQKRAVTERDLDGRIHVASFLFAECPSVCPLLVTRLRKVQEAVRDMDDVMMVSYSVTPKTDTPDVLADFGRLRGIDAAKWRLLTGDLAQVSRVIRDSYFADDQRKVEGAPESRIVHTEKVLLVDGARRLRGIYNGTNAFELERLVEDIRALRAERAETTN